MVKRSASAPKAGMPSGNSLRVALAIFSAIFGCINRCTLAEQFVEADTVDDVERVEDIALRLDISARPCAHQAGDIDVLERHFIHEMIGRHDHARDPEEDDVEPVTSTLLGT